MSQFDFKTFDSLAFRWDSTQLFWFILVEEDGFPLLCFSAGKNEDREWKSQSMTTIEARSGLMGEASHEARFNITDVICAPSIKCIIAADSFIKGFERDQKGKMKNLNIKIDGGLSESIEGYYLQKQFRSLALERGYAVDEVYETSVKWSENGKIDPYVNLNWRINAALESFRKKYSVSKHTMVAVFVDKSLESVLRDVGAHSGVEKDAGEWKFQSMPMAEKKSRVMGAASYKSCFNITDVISAPSTKCILAADSFIKGFESGQQDTTNPLKIKVEAALSKSVEGYYSHKQFQLLAIERGYRVDDSYETCAQRSGNSEVDPYVDLDCRISAALESFKEKYSGSEEKMVVVFVDKRLESVLRHVANLSNMAYELYVPAVEDIPLNGENAQK
ncbi:hypothetical protein T4C_12100 [Trichinella pseudospiralis]|uniref:Uncharacterized protein n=1 Tax=Trichinella pseudospiralis TaxID=6337 RepID=A0A0V1JLP1_TRIPS|nr:hypothetical protein T4C_12100 [Trichinella pseudospiralis]